MKPMLAWVIGRNGLLGSHLVRALARRSPEVDCWSCPTGRLRWSEPKTLECQLRRAVAEFAKAAQSSSYWAVAWAAGAGVVGSTAAALDQETTAWTYLLDQLAENFRGRPKPPGVVFHASSAGGVYGHGGDAVITEATPACPLSEYGRNKLRQEAALVNWASDARAGFVIGRISNLYGPGQNLTKPQGLVAHLSRCLLHRRPLSIYVPLDTIRDLIFVEDCAELIVRCLVRGRTLSSACRVVKLIASEQATTVGRVLGIFTRLSRTPVKILRSPSPLAKQQGRTLLFRSQVWPDLRADPLTSLEVGIHSVHQHQAELFRRGLLPPPAVSA